MDTTTADVVVVGAGFGGLSAALHLAAAGKRVVVCEMLGHPGGCASTFNRRGEVHEAGATLFAGFDGGWMQQLVDGFGLEVTVRFPDPVMHYRDGSIAWDIPRDRAAFVDFLASRPEANGRAVRAFFAEQHAVANLLWKSFDDPTRLPPLGWQALRKHLADTPLLGPLLRGVGRPLASRIRAHDLHTDRTLVAWLDAVCQITVQTDSSRAETPVAMAAIDYLWRGAAHVEGGIGALAQAMVDAVERRGGRVLLGNRVQRVESHGTGWEVQTRKGTFRAPAVVCNLLPQDVDRLVSGTVREDAQVAAVRRSWGAAMLYLQMTGEGPSDDAFHAQCRMGPGVTEGQLVFVSVGPKGEGTRAATVSTHLPIGAAPERVSEVQATMRETLKHCLPELSTVTEMTGSARTFERFTRREAGRVGGVPRTAGLWNYRQLWPVQRWPGVWLVGDSVFPGQSALAVCVGGYRVADALLRRAAY